ncbi:hypothetical protein OG203_03565 [Nocardia sp. NBC_01499]|uniref:hypothetical protein n=1 Tax=Nocardia sp. NBC_01499 TaxID=2903597 RepID=UPI003867F06D
MALPRCTADFYCGKCGRRAGWTSAEEHETDSGKPYYEVEAMFDQGDSPYP